MGIDGCINVTLNDAVVAVCRTATSRASEGFLANRETVGVSVCGRGGGRKRGRDGSSGSGRSGGGAKGGWEGRIYCVNVGKGGGMGFK